MSLDQTAQQMPQIMERGGAAVAASTGAVSWFANYASIATVCIAAAGFLVALAGLIWQIRRDKARRKEERALFEAKMAELGYKP